LLLTLLVKNFTLVESLEIDFSQGMTALTGETGAGKSLIVDALAMALGDRADTEQVRNTAERAEVSAIFDISEVPHAKQWLKNYDFDSNNGDCVLRRVLTKEGRSRGHINGQLATMQQLRELGETLIDIHNQHEHQSLLRRETHRHILDNFAGCINLTKTTKKLFHEWSDAKKQLTRLEGISKELMASRKLLAFQVEELTNLNISEGELQSLEQEQVILANAESILTDSNALLQICSDDEHFNLEIALNNSLQILQKMHTKPNALAEAEKLLLSAQIEIQEASTEIQQHLNSFSAKPEKLKQVEDRLSEIYQLARKYQTPPEQLYQKSKELINELKNLSASHNQEALLKQETQEMYKIYLKAASELTTKRLTASEKLTVAIQEQFELLSMSGAHFKVSLAPLANENLGAHGQDSIEFLISTNPGEPSKPLARIASGGELSRISLSIQAIAAKNSPIPTLVFDEVDVGIGGATADTVGKMLRILGSTGQILCITHQPQVAAQAHNHMLVSKNTTNNVTYSKITNLSIAEKINEVARMLGGANITNTTLDHAKEMIGLVKSN